MLVRLDSLYCNMTLLIIRRVFDPPEDTPVQRFSRFAGPTGKKVKDQTFAFDKVFDENASQGDVYESTTKNLLDSVLDGYNATVFAYGATGCGKTHTITGTVQQPGIIFLTMQELFERIAELQEEKVTEVTLSYLEIYNETIRDLLSPGGGKQGLMLREDANQAVSVAGLSSHRPQDVRLIRSRLPLESADTRLGPRSHGYADTGKRCEDAIPNGRKRNIIPLTRRASSQRCSERPQCRCF